MLVGMSVVKNEADVIEPMIRHNLQFLDHMTIIDNGSADETTSVVKALIDEGLNCQLIERPGTTHLQHIILSDLVPSLMSTHSPNRIVVLDADEFIIGNVKDVRAEFSDRDRPIKLPWVTYVPTPDDDPTEANVLKRVIHRRKAEVPPRYKITIPASVADGAQVGHGSHRLHCNGKKVFMKLSVSASLAHFPVRSAEQLIAKILIGAWSVRQRNRWKGEASHWLDLAERFLKSQTLNASDLSELALRYTGTDLTHLVRDPVQTDIGLRHPVDPSQTMLKKIIGYTEDVIRQMEVAGPTR